MAACPLCRQRKGKRACPAKGELICAACCGQKRRIEIDCPEDCVWLGAHAGAWEGRETERTRDLRRLAPHLEGLSDPQARLLFLSLVGVTALRGRRALDDELLLEATAALRKTVETREKGILYEHPAEDLRAQGLVPELRGLFEAKDEQGIARAPADKDLLAVLRALEGVLGDVVREGAGPAAFLDTAARVAARMGVAPRAPGRPLIVEP
ncbi:MAG: hypothetical protein DMF79_18235 [Acidobacteria bacterium]|nr:MAG: hypothetical protein DMF79_18235 [Acidobacteriota bacterium]